MSNTINPEYSRKLVAAAMIADTAWLKGGVALMESELSFLRRVDADPVIIAEVDRITKRQIAMCHPTSCP